MLDIVLDVTSKNAFIFKNIFNYPRAMWSKQIARCSWGTTIILLFVKSLFNDVSLNKIIEENHVCIFIKNDNLMVTV
jgi:hypothetical protein